MKHLIGMAAAMITAFAMTPAHALEVTHDIQAQGRAALAEIQAELRGRVTRAPEQVDEKAGVRQAVSDAIRVQGKDALRIIAWENEAVLHTRTLVAGQRGTPAATGTVLVSAPTLLD